MSFWIYLLLIVFIILVINLFILLKNKNKKIEEQVDYNIKKKIDSFKTEYEKSQNILYDLKFTEWRNNNEFEIRRFAIHMNKTSITDTISEQVSIINNNFAFNPKDIKFVGRFIDLIIFDGAADDEQVTIYFVEIQNKSHLDKNGYRAKVEKAIQQGSFDFTEINL